MSTVVAKDTQQEKTDRHHRVLHILNETTGVSECGLVRPKHGGPFDRLNDSNRHLVCVVCLELSGV